MSTQYRITDTNSGATLIGDKYEIEEQFSAFYGIDAETPADVTETAQALIDGLSVKEFTRDSDAAAYLQVEVEQA